MIPGDQNLVSFNRGRTPLSKAVPRLHLSEVVPLPHQLAIHRVAIQASRSKVGVDVFAIGTWGRRRKVIGAVRFLMGRGHGRNLLPQQLAVGTIKTEERELERLQPIRTVASAASRGHSGNHEHAVIPDDGRARALAWNLYLPLHILAVAPLQRRGCIFRYSVAVSSPVRPVVGKQQRRENHNREDR